MDLFMVSTFVIVLFTALHGGFLMKYACNAKDMKEHVMKEEESGQRGQKEEIFLSINRIHHECVDEVYVNTCFATGCIILISVVPMLLLTFYPWIVVSIFLLSNLAAFYIKNQLLYRLNRKFFREMTEELIREKGLLPELDFWKLDRLQQTNIIHQAKLSEFLEPLDEKFQLFSRH